MNNIPDKNIIGAGDVKQLPPVCDDLTNTRNAGEYSDECIDQIFKYNILFKACKRLGPKDDPKAVKNREILDSMYDDMWIYRIPLEEFVLKYCKVTDNMLDALYHIAYINMRCLNVSNYIRKHLGKKDKYEVGDTLICRVNKNMGNQRFNLNYRYRIIRMILSILSLENVKSKEKFTIVIYILDKHFRYDYCTTCHSAQGASIDGQIIIHEWEKKYLVTREWIWCALTRSTDFF